VFVFYLKNQQVKASQGRKSPVSFCRKSGFVGQFFSHLPSFLTLLTLTCLCLNNKDTQQKFLDLLWVNIPFPRGALR
jgi:hypothetical protein